MARVRALVSAVSAAALLVGGCGTRGTSPPAAQTGQQGQPTQRAQGSQAAGPKADERGAVLKKEQKGSASVEEASAVAGRFLAGASPLPAKHAVDWHRLEYQSTDREEKPLKVVAQL